MNQLTYRGVKYPVQFDWDNLVSKILMPDGTELIFSHDDDTLQLWLVVCTLKTLIDTELSKRKDTGVETD